MDVNLTPRTRGRAPKQVEAEVVRELRPEDLVLLDVEKGSETPALKRLTQRHHALARLIASGLKPGEAAMCVDYSPSRVSILQNDPSFKELVQFYKEAADERYVEMHEKLSGLSQDALLELQQRIEDEPESFSNGMLLEIVTKLADRTGHGPSATQTNVNVSVNLAERLQAARERVASYKQIEGEANAVSEPETDEGREGPRGEGS